MSSVRDRFIAAITAGHSTAEATKIANAGPSARNGAVLDLPLPTVDEIVAMSAEDLARFLTAEAVKLPDDADEEALRALAFGAIGAEAPAPSQEPSEAPAAAEPPTREAVEAMDKPALLDVLRGQGANPDGRSGVAQLRTEAIALLFPGGADV